MAATPPGWPFFARSTGPAVAAALDLAGLAPGEHLVDLGCGEGDVLVAAAGRGACVTGVECDEELAATARHALHDAGLSERARVLVDDMFRGGLWESLTPPDVVFGYLSPATLQRLTPTLRHLQGTRLATLDFGVPDLVPDRRASWSGAEQGAAGGSVFLYRLPGRVRRPRRARPGWTSAGTLCIAVPDVTSLTCLDAIHRGGPVELRLTGELAEHASAVAGLDTAPPRRLVTVDVRWQPRPAGTLAHGTVELDGLGSHPLTVLFAEEEQGQWNLSPEGCTAVADRLRTPPTPTAARDLLDPLGC